MSLGSCDVLRCTTPAVHTMRLGADDATAVEWAVCHRHQRQIHAGVPVRWDADPTEGTPGALVLGTDVEPAGLTITEVIAVEEHGLVVAPEGSPAVTLILEKLNSDLSREEVRITLSHEVMDQLASIFEVQWRRRP